MNTNESKVRGLQWLVRIGVVAILLSLLYGFSERPALFHDEIINLGKAGDFHVFDYAMRPVFYGLNALTVKYLGGDISSQTLLAYLLFVALGIQCYRFVSDDLGWLPGITCLALIAWCGPMYVMGLQGMPHLLPAVLMVSAYFLAKPSAHIAKGRRWLISLTIWLAVLSHPTALALAIGFFAYFFAALAFEVNFRVKAFVEEVLRWTLPMVAIWLVVEITYYFCAPEHKFYVVYWYETLRRIPGQEYSGYFKPFAFYFLRVWEIFRPLLTLLALLVLSRVVSLIRFKSFLVEIDKKTLKTMVALIAGALVSLLIISLEKWKFERVFVSFMPLTALSLCYALFVIAGSFRKGSRWLTWLCAIAITASSLLQFSTHAVWADRHFRSLYTKYSRAFDVINRLNVRTLGYVGRPQHERLAAVPVAAAQRSLVDIELERRRDRLDAASVMRDVLGSGQRFIILDARDAASVRAFHDFAYQERLSLIGDILSRRSFEIWDAAPSTFGLQVGRLLDSMNRHERVGLLLDQSDVWVRWGLDRLSVPVRHLRIKRGSLVNDRNVTVLFISVKHFHRSMSRSLAAQGFKKAASIGYSASSGDTVEVWEQSRR